MDLTIRKNSSSSIEMQEQVNNSTNNSQKQQNTDIREYCSVR